MATVWAVHTRNNGKQEIVSVTIEMFEKRANEFVEVIKIFDPSETGGTGITLWSLEQAWMLHKVLAHIIDSAELMQTEEG
jgi:hypothetical protein